MLNNARRGTFDDDVDDDDDDDGLRDAQVAACSRCNAIACWTGRPQSNDLWCGSRRDSQGRQRSSVIGCAAGSGRAGYWW